MADVTEDDHPPFDLTLADRRRRGRTDYQNAHLIALLRGESLDIDPAETEVNPKALLVDDLATARGVVIGVSVGTAMWVGIIFAVRYFM